MQTTTTMYENLFGGSYSVSDDDVSFFQQNGYVRFDDVLSEDEVRVLQEGLDTARTERRGFVRDLAANGGKTDVQKNRILQMLNLWEMYPQFSAYVLNGRIGRMAARLTGSGEIYLYHDQALVKEPGPSAASPWHQDQPYWPSSNPGMVSCWMALDDVTVERGCMQFIPGSHKWGEFPPIEFVGEGPGLRDFLSEDQQAAWNPVPVELDAGDCTFHHGLTFHYTNPNTTDHVRRALVAIFIPEGITYAADEKMDNPFSDSITSKKGEPLRGTRFPRLV